MAKQENIKLNKYILWLCKKIWQELIDANDPVIQQINAEIEAGERKDGRWYDFNWWYIANYPTFVWMYVANFGVWSDDKGASLSSFEKSCFLAWVIEWSDFWSLICGVDK